MRARVDSIRMVIVALLVIAGLGSGASAQALAETFFVDNRDPSASDQNSGGNADPLKTINRAAQLARPGDTVIVRAGVYRERVAPARGGTPEQPIAYEAAAGAEVVIKGSEIWKPRWQQRHDQLPIYAGELSPDLFRDSREHPYRTRLKGMPLGGPMTLGQVFVDGKPLREVDNLDELRKKESAWLASADGNELTVHFPHPTVDPSQRLVEVTTRQRIFAPHRRGLGYIHVRGFVMEHCANQFPERFWESHTPQAGALSCRAGHHWQIEDNTVRFAKSIGIDCGYEGKHDLEGNQPTPANTGYHLIRGNRISNNGCCGIAGMRSIGTRIVENIVENNNRNLHTAPEAGGIKVHHFVDGWIEGNLVRRNEAHGIWLDNVYRNARVTRNVAIGNRGSAVFVELGQGPVLIDNNVLAQSELDLRLDDRRADGLGTVDASGVVFTHNLVFGCRRFGESHRQISNRPGAGVENISSRNNVFVDNQVGHVDWPYPGPDVYSNRLDHNLFSAGGSFLFNAYGPGATKEMIDTLKSSLGTGPKLRRGNSPILNLQDWQRRAFLVKDNVESEGARVSIAPDFVLVLDLGPAFHQHRVVPARGVERDFFGNRLPAESALMGPFQGLASGQSRLTIWPMVKR